MPLKKDAVKRDMESRSLGRKGPMKLYQIRMDEGLASELRAWAEGRGLTLSAAVRMAVSEHLDRQR